MPPRVRLLRKVSLAVAAAVKHGWPAGMIRPDDIPWRRNNRESAVPAFSGFYGLLEVAARLLSMAPRAEAGGGGVNCGFPSGLEKTGADVSQRPRPAMQIRGRG